MYTVTAVSVGISVTPVIPINKIKFEFLWQRCYVYSFLFDASSCILYSIPFTKFWLLGFGLSIIGIYDLTLG